MIVKDRIDERVTILTNCQLEIESRKYDCLVENISTVGALIGIDKSSQKYIQVGDKGSITVLLLIPVKYVCIVVRKFPGHIGLQFVGH